MTQQNLLNMLFNEIMRRNKELEREVRTLQDRLNTLTTENKELRNILNTRRNSNKMDNEIKQDNSKKKVDDENIQWQPTKTSAPKHHNKSSAKMTLRIKPRSR